MIIDSWNCRGLSSAQKISVARDLIENEKSFILLIQETKLQVEDIAHTPLGTTQQWGYIAEDSRGASEGLCTLWNKKTLTLVSSL